MYLCVCVYLLRFFSDVDRTSRIFSIARNMNNHELFIRTAAMPCMNNAPFWNSSTASAAVKIAALAVSKSIENALLLNFTAIATGCIRKYLCFPHFTLQQLV